MRVRRTRSIGGVSNRIAKKVTFPDEPDAYRHAGPGRGRTGAAATRAASGPGDRQSGPSAAPAAPRPPRARTRPDRERAAVIETDVALVGAGAAGLSLAHRLAHPAPGARPLSAVLREAPPGPLWSPHRRPGVRPLGRGPDGRPHPQPARGVSFRYALPTGQDTALVEYTEFSTPAAPTPAAAAPWPCPARPPRPLPRTEECP
ncbi:lycopene cyclase family protein [Streptomyces sp. NPDC017095]|uniref:lycopene cyclase family protein n=1 Tax=Streptomyces sp. NPDC017095 TaxID=3364977 RepID=UPI0037A22815